MAEVDFSIFLTLLEFASMKVNIVYNDVPLKEMMLRSEFYLSNIERMTKTKKAVNMLVNIVAFDQFLVMKEIVSQGNVSLEGMNPDDNNHLLSLALRNESFHMIAYLLIFGLDPYPVWSSAKINELRQEYIYDDEYGLQFVEKYLKTI